MKWEMKESKLILGSFALYEIEICVEICCNFMDFFKYM